MKNKTIILGTITYFTIIVSIVIGLGFLMQSCEKELNSSEELTLKTSSNDVRITRLECHYPTCSTCHFFFNEDNNLQCTGCNGECAVALVTTKSSGGGDVDVVNAIDIAEYFEEFKFYFEEVYGPIEELKVLVQEIGTSPKLDYLLLEFDWEGHPESIMLYQVDDDKKKKVSMLDCRGGCQAPEKCVEKASMSTGKVFCADCSICDEHATTKKALAIHQLGEEDYQLLVNYIDTAFNTENFRILDVDKGELIENDIQGLYVQVIFDTPYSQSSTFTLLVLKDKKYLFSCFGSCDDVTKLCDEEIVAPDTIQCVCEGDKCIMYKVLVSTE